ncbi:hypothetical protein CFN78_23740 [Amycolatopsis antarctica]|uniref:Uncharacterized protein n=1 Tax=Amycolatopsis antarctica TaxID=1854586 RepID=A0A263CXH5_9PSEU|nr:hypothetical protein [Amycolatopsis antarctica]OZM70689.1 hypothetical protein CFN78_23740 [Amycolatopsis antarctica]
MTVTDLPLTPARRDIKGMTALLANLKDKTQIAVTFKRDTYGLFTVEGPAVKSPAVKTFMVGSLFIESGLKPDKAVQSIRYSDTTNTDATVDDPDALRGTVNGVGHGDLVAATFEQAPHGRFTVTGVAVHTADTTILTVGSWFLVHRGSTATRLQALTVLADAGTHTLPVPAPITAWESDDPSTT